VQTIPNPGPTTYRDDPGYELDVVVSTIGDTLEAVQAKLGTGATIGTAALAANAVTQRTISSGFAGTRTAAGFADVDSTNGKATLTTTGGDLLAFFFGSSSNNLTGVVQRIAMRLDATADVGLIAVYSVPGAASYPTPFCTVQLFTGVAAGTHSVFARHTNDSAAGTMSTNGQIVLLEIKR
jgi:hypothetical protein